MVLKAELDEDLDREKQEKSEVKIRNSKSKKTVKSFVGDLVLNIPRAQTSFSVY